MQKAGVGAFLPHNEDWGAEEIEFLLQDKITQRTSKSSDQFRQAFRLFASDGDLTPALFEAQVNKMLGTTVNKKHAMNLFRRYDTDGSGDIDLQEFIAGLMPKDYAPPPAFRKFPRMTDNSNTIQLKFGFSPKKPHRSSPSRRDPRSRARQELPEKLKLKNVKGQVEPDLLKMAAPVMTQDMDLKDEPQRLPILKGALLLPVSNNHKEDGVPTAAAAIQPLVAPVVTALNLKVDYLHTLPTKHSSFHAAYPVDLFALLPDICLSPILPMQHQKKKLKNLSGSRKGRNCKHGKRLPPTSPIRTKLPPNVSACPVLLLLRNLALNLLRPCLLASLFHSLSLSFSLSPPPPLPSPRGNRWVSPSTLLASL
jgi:hypothetical protein